jgi:hypothetical protein
MNLVAKLAAFYSGFHINETRNKKHYFRASGARLFGEMLHLEYEKTYLQKQQVTQPW